MAWTPRNVICVIRNAPTAITCTSETQFIHVNNKLILDDSHILFDVILEMSICPTTGRPAIDLALNHLTSRKAFFCETFTLKLNAGSASITGQITTLKNIFVNAETGSDLNDGTTGATAVATIQTALNLLVNIGQYVECVVIQLEGSKSFNVGTTLNFFPASSFAGKFIFRGQQQNIINDTVQSIVGFGPNNTFQRVTGSVGNYGPSVYLSKFIWNRTQDEVFVIKDNTNIDIDTIAGDTPSDFGPGEPSVAFNIGDSFTLFETGTDVEFGQRVTINNPQGNPIQFDNIHFVATSDEAQWVNPFVQSVTYRGCWLDARHPVAFYSESEPCYFGSCNILGCYSENVSVATYFTDFEQGTCVRSKSMWLNGPEIRFSEACSVLFLYATNAVARSITTRNASLLGLSIWIENNARQGIYIGGSSTCAFHNTLIESSIQSNNVHLFEVDECCVVYFTGTCELLQNAPGTQRGCLNIRSSSRVYLETSNNVVNLISAGTEVINVNGLSLFVIGGANINIQTTAAAGLASSCLTFQNSLCHIFPFTPSGLTMTQTNQSTVPMISMVNDSSLFLTQGNVASSLNGNTTSANGVLYALRNSKITMTASSPLTIQNASSAPAIVCRYNSTLVLSNNGYTFNTPSPAPILEIRQGSSGSSTNPRNNTGGGANNSLQLGGNAIQSSPAVTANDLASGIPENCFYFSI